MIEPFLSDDAFLADMQRSHAASDELRVWWLGQSAFLVRYAGRFLLLDPYLSDSLTAKYAGSDKPHVRMTRRVIAPDRLTPIHLITSSHNHTDHLDAETLQSLIRTNPDAKLIVPEANRDVVAKRLQLNANHLIGLDDGGSVKVDSFEIHGIAAAHNELLRDDRGHYSCLGYIIRGGLKTIYHSGDTLRYPGLAEKLRPFSIDLALLPINGNKPERRVAGNLDGREAAQLAHDIGARLVIPCHYEMFEFNTADPSESFIPECKRLGQPYFVLRAGESSSL